jgi:hypothetical protein
MTDTLYSTERVADQVASSVFQATCLALAAALPVLGDCERNCEQA